jgi:hypothetical protein
MKVYGTCVGHLFEMPKPIDQLPAIIRTGWLPSNAGAYPFLFLGNTGKHFPKIFHYSNIPLPRGRNNDSWRKMN